MLEGDVAQHAQVEPGGGGDDVGFEDLAGLQQDTLRNEAVDVVGDHAHRAGADRRQHVAVRQDGDALAPIRPGFTHRFSIYDDEEQLSIIKSAYRGLGLDEKDFMQYRAALSRISHGKNRKQTPQDFYKSAVNKEGQSIAALFEEYEKALHNANALDFDDLLLESVRLGPRLARVGRVDADWSAAKGGLDTFDLTD